MKTRTLAAVADPDGIKTSLATTERNHTGEALDGALTSADLDPPRTVTVTTASAVGAYAVGVLGRVAERIAGIRAGSAGNVGLVYSDGRTDVVPLLQGERLEGFDADLARIVAATTTALPLTLLQD